MCRGAVGWLSRQRAKESAPLLKSGAHRSSENSMTERRRRSGGQGERREGGADFKF